MIPANEKDLENLMEDYTKFRNLGNGEMKAAWLAASGRGFSDIVESNKNDILLIRETDKKFIVFSYATETQKPQQVENKNSVKFHVDRSVLKCCEIKPDNREE
jgi:hypothetical protein